MGDYLNPESLLSYSRTDGDPAWVMTIYPVARRIAGVRSACALSKTSADAIDREDLQQEALTAIWATRLRYDPSRGSRRAFMECVAATRVASALRRARRQPRFDSIDIDQLLASDTIPVLELRIDLQSAFASLLERDRKLSLFLMEHTPTEAGRMLGVSRSNVYRAIRRIRVTFAQAGLEPRRNKRTASTGKHDDCDWVG